VRINCKPLSRNIKNKNAAGLAGLAARLYQNERAVLSALEPENQQAVFRVATFLKDPVKYWKWIEAQDEYEYNSVKVHGIGKYITGSYLSKTIE